MYAVVLGQDIWTVTICIHQEDIKECWPGSRWCQSSASQLLGFSCLGPANDETTESMNSMIRLLIVFDSRGLKKHLGLECSSSQSASEMFSYLRREAVASEPACYDNAFRITGRWKSQNKFFKMEQGYPSPQTETLKPGDHICILVG